MSSRREFLERTTGSVAALGAWSLSPSLAMAAGLPAGGASSPRELHAGIDDGAAQAPWDVSWAKRIGGKHKALFDVAEVESGIGVWRANAWFGQYQQVLKSTPAELSPVIVLRHNAIILALRQTFWDRYGIGQAKGVTHPLTMQPLAKNPALLDEQDGIPAPFSQAGLHKQLARGAIVLACDLAVQVLVMPLVKQADKVSDEAAHKIVVDALVPGVILQPSGIFACVMAQEAGCAYVKAA